MEALDDDIDHHPSVTSIRNPHPHTEERGNPRPTHRTDTRQTGEEEEEGRGVRAHYQNKIEWAQRGPDGF